MSKKEAYTFTSEDAENYDHFLGPVLFEPYGKYLASQIDTANLSSVLELASGTGRVTGFLREVLPANAEFWATDLNAGMLGIAKRRLGAEGINYSTEDIQSLSFADNSFDLVVCQFGMMFLPDKQKGFNEIYRVLKPGGKLLCFTWDTTVNNPLFGLLIDELMLPHFAGEDNARFFVPFSLHNPELLAGWLGHAGFSSISTKSVALHSAAVPIDHIEVGVYKVHPLGKAMRDKSEEAYRLVGQKFTEEVEKRFGAPVSFPMSALFTEGTK